MSFEFGIPESAMKGIFRLCEIINVEQQHQRTNVGKTKDESQLQAKTQYNLLVVPKQISIRIRHAGHHCTGSRTPGRGTSLVPITGISRGGDR